MNSTLWPNPSTLRDLTPHQGEAVSLALSKPFGLLCGVPGSGKTFALASIVQSVADTFGISSLSICAPTGKAAVRITESLQRYGLPIEAKTIHRTLGVNRLGYDGKGWGFTFGPDRPLPSRFVFIDEISMLDTSLAAQLFKACSPGTHVLCVGDHHQLPPVGSGAPLRDFIQAGIPCGLLTEIKRNSGSITRACEAIRDGRRATPDFNGIDISRGLNWLHRECHRSAYQLAELKQLIETLPSSVNPIWDVQVLCATNEKGEVSRKELNRELQAVLNPSGSSVGGKFRVNDKVICTSNTLLELVPDAKSNGRHVGLPREYGDECPPDRPKEFVANGEIGRVVGSAMDANTGRARGFTVRFDAPSRTIVVPIVGKKSEAKGDDEHAGAAVDFDLGYAITTHKAQGSQAPIVIAVIDEHARFVCSREWWTTALSRAERMVCTVGRLDVMHKHCRRSELQGRKTFLAERLKAALSP